MYIHTYGTLSKDLCSACRVQLMSTSPASAITSAQHVPPCTETHIVSSLHGWLAQLCTQSPSLGKQLRTVCAATH